MQPAARMLVATCLGLASLAAGPIDTAGNDVDSAQKQTDSATSKLNGLTRSISASIESLGALLRLVDDERTQRNRLLPLVDAAIRQSEIYVAEAQKEFSTRELELRKATGALDDAKTVLTQRQRGIELAINLERKAFESSDRFTHATELVQSKSATLDRLAVEIAAQLESHPDVVVATRTVATCDMDLQQLRTQDPGNTAAIAQASARLMGAKNALANLRRSIQDQNQPYRIAVDELRASQAALSVMKNEFESSLASRPAIVDARAARDDAEQSVHAWEEAVADARRALDRQKADIETRKADVEVLARIKKESDTQLRHIQVEIRVVQQDLAEAVKQLDGSTELLKDAQRSLRRAEAALDDAEKESRKQR